MTSIFRRNFGMGCFSSVLLLALPKVTQAAEGIGSVLAQAGGAVGKRSNYTLEGIVVVAVFGIAGFVVCRGSRRV